jgi:hypothetical protein
MGDHYIPRYYQKGFSVEDNEKQVYLYRKGANEGVKTNIIKTGQENDFYSDEIETRITQEIEQVSNPILDKIKKW